MATVNLSAAFNTENFWADRSGAVTTKTPTLYVFPSALGFVRVTGSDFTYIGDAILSGNYTSIEISTNSGFTGIFATYTSLAGIAASTFFLNGSTDGLAGADTINGSGGADTITSHGGGDTLDGKGGNDTYVVNQSDLVAGWSLNDSGASGIDTLRLIGGASFSFNSRSVGGLEALSFTGEQFAFFNASQLPGSGGQPTLAVTGVDATTQTIEVFNATNFSAAQWSFKTWAATDVLAIFGTSGADTIVGSSKNDTITGHGGADALDGASGSDTYAFDILEVSPGLVIHDTGKSGIDTISLEGAFPIDFTGALISGIEAIEQLAFSAIFNADQLPAHLSVTGSGLVIQNATNFSAALWVFAAPSFVSISGTNIADTITGSTQSDLISGANGNDLLLGGLGNDSLDGGDDIDTASYRDSAAGVTVSLTISGAQNTIGAGTDTLINVENLIGSNKADHLTGDGNANVLTGLRGKDSLSGDLGADIFDFNAKIESVKGANRDVVEDFSGINVLSGDLDRIDLSGIDAKRGHGNQAFHWIGAHKFHHKAGELHVLNKGASFLVEGDIDGNGRADFQIEVHSAAALAKGDFIF